MAGADKRLAEALREDALSGDRFSLKNCTNDAIPSAIRDDLWLTVR